MKNIIIWKKLSNISGYTCLAVAAIHAFFKSYLASVIPVIIGIEIVALIVFLISETMKFALKRNGRL
jgi:hypothetical protein